MIHHEEPEAHEGRKGRGVSFSGNQYAPLHALRKEELIHLPHEKQMPGCAGASRMK